MVWILLAVTVPVTAFAREYVWLIGGGPDPGASQAQIELNVIWVISSLKELVPHAVVRVFYADGTSLQKGAHEWRPASDTIALQALARVFGEEIANGSRYRRHRVPDVIGSTRADVLVPELERGFAELKEGDQALIVYNGHGSWHADRAENGLRLWGESHLSVRQFERLLSRIDPAVPVRFVFTQCYSGAFERAVHPAAADVKTLAEGTRCGFFAASEDRESEGCSASVNIGDYRDYTTYFFAALTGRTRLGKPIEGNADLGHDGTVTPFEAHLYVLAESHSADLPRSTSEVYLERWMPWYTRWLQPRDLPDNAYGRIARALARKNGLPEDGPQLGRAIERRHQDLVSRQEDLQRESLRLETAVAGVQDTMLGGLAQRWPEALHPYTAGFRDFLRRDVEAAERYILDHPAYSTLVANQARLADVEIALMALDRDVTQLEKLRRTRTLARALWSFRRLASERDRAAYGGLRACEELPL